MDSTRLEQLSTGQHLAFFANNIGVRLQLRVPLEEFFHMKRTYQPSVVRRKRTHGFLVRMRTRGGRAVIRARRSKGRQRLAV